MAFDLGIAVNIVYAYGLLPPEEGAELLLEEMLRGHRYYNRLVEIHRASQASWDEARSSLVDPRRVELEARLVAVRQQITEARARMKGARSGAGDKAVLSFGRAQVAALTTERAHVLADLRAFRASPHATHVATRVAAWWAEEKTRVSAAVREARGASGLAWGTYQAIEEAWTAACKASAKRGVLPHFRRWEGEGTVAVHFQNEQVRDVADMPDAWCRIVSSPPRAPTPEHPTVGRRARQRARLCLRVGKVGLIAEWPMVLHRPLPEGGRVTWIKVTRRRHATQYKWAVCFTVQIPDPEEAANQRSVGIDLGWRSRRDGSLRMAVWHDGAGAEGELVLPATIRDRWEQANRVRGHRDEDLRDLRAFVVQALSNTPDLPEEVRQALRWMPRWNSPARFVALLRRFGGSLPAGVVERLTAWGKRDRHLWQYETGLRRGALLARREVARLFAHFLVGRYGRIVMEDFDLRQVIVKPAEEERPDDPDVLRAHAENLGSRQRTIVAPGELRRIIKDAARKEGIRFEVVPPEYTTLTCHLCGFTETWDKLPSVDHTCGGCGRRWDQDKNAAILILRRAIPAAVSATG